MYTLSDVRVFLTNQKFSSKNSLNYPSESIYTSHPTVLPFEPLSPCVIKNVNQSPILT